ncbi:MAG: AEC family transporter [Caldilineaceae bacterium]
MQILATLLSIFIQTILPVFLVAGAGFVLAGAVQIDSRSVGRLLFYLATPSLVFRSLYRTALDFSVLEHLAIVAVSVGLVSGLLGWIISFDQARKQRAALILASAVSNNGNMGISISFFAFGEAGMALGAIYYVVMSFMSNTIGVMVASAGETVLAKALRQSLKAPVLYMALAGLLANATQVQLPQSLTSAIDLLANAAIPGMLILLGIQLRHAPLFHTPGVILRSVFIRLLVAPCLAWLLCNFLLIQGLERNILLLQSGMPTAVMAAVLATEFEAEPQLVAAVIFISTLLSMVTLSVMLWLLM